MFSTDAENRIDPPRSQENRRLKVAGMVLIAIAAIPIFYLTDVDWKASLNDRDQWRFVSLGLVYLIAANVFTLGVIVLLAGFRNLPLLTNPKAKRGALVKLAGANLLIICSGFVFLEDAKALGEAWEESWIYLVVIAGFLGAARMGVVLTRRGWKYDAVSADELLAQDPRRPIVYVRSFRDDERMTVAAGGWRSLFTPLAWTAAISAEQELAIIMNRIGPVVAIGKPGESLPELGAARLYVGDHAWQAKITELMKRAKLVVVRAGTTANLRWEIDQAVTLLPLHQLILVSLGQGEDANSFAQDIEQRFGRPEHLNSTPRGLQPRWRVGLATPLRCEIGSIIYFGNDSKPYIEPIRLFVPTWKWLVLVAYRPHQVSLESAFRRVFKQLNLPWVDRKSRATAALLGVFLGWFGCHHFYLGDKRRGIYYLLFWWTLVPLFLAWRDAIRLALTDEEEFERNYGYQGRTEEPT